jgi:predicted Zn-ribbon and HTH transcriptional regulator
MEYSSVAKKELKLHWEVDCKTFKRVTYTSQYRGKMLVMFPPNDKDNQYVVTHDDVVIASAPSKSQLSEKLYKHFNK